MKAQARLTRNLSASAELSQGLNGSARLNARMVTGVTSWNGETGDVTYAAPVTSVNGRTGEVTGLQDTLYYEANGNRYPVTGLLKTVTQGVEGVLLTYDDGTVTGSEVFFANGEGLYTVLSNVNAAIATKADASAIPTVPSNVSAFTNDAGYVTASTAPVRSVNGQTGVVTLTIPTVPTNVSAFTNDAGYLTLADLPVYNGGVN